MNQNQGHVLKCKNPLCFTVNGEKHTLLIDEGKRNSSMQKYFWAVEYKCPNCASIYYTCNICDKAVGNRNLLYRSSLYRHHGRHKNNPSEGTVSNSKKLKMSHSLNTSKEDKCDLMIEHEKEMITNVNDLVPRKDEDGIVQDWYDRQETWHYFHLNNSKTRPNDGPSYLVGRALSETNYLHESMNCDDIMLNLLITKFVAKLSKSQRLEFAFILQMLQKKTKRDDNKQDDQKSHKTDKDFNFQTSIPLSDCAIRNVYTIGTNSIIKNLPRPEVNMIDGHSYVSVRQCILYILGCGKMPEEVCQSNTVQVKNISMSRMYKDVYQRAIAANPDVPSDNLMVLMGLSWSDDFDPNSSIKANRGAVWIRTVTFVTRSFKENRLDDTYAISIGLKEQSHDKVESQFVCELEELRSGKNNTFFSKEKQCNVKVHFEVIAYLADQPERRSLNYLMLGNSRFGGRFGYSADIELLASRLCMCKSCLKKCKNDKNFISSGVKCDNCLQWNLMANHELAKFHPPKDYPSEMIPVDGKLEPIPISFDALKEVVYLASEKYLSGKWTVNNVVAYTSCWAINKNGQQKLIDHCDNMKTMKIVREDVSVEENVKDVVLLDSQIEPDKYEQWKGGVYWRSSSSLNNFPDVIMHLLFLGVVKASKELLSKWIAEEKVYKTYTNKSKYMLKTILDVGLDWCKVLNTNTGWVSDNYLAYARILKWIHHPMTMNNQERKDVSSRNDINCHISIVDNFIGSLLSTIASIMTRVVDDNVIGEVHREILIYLSNLDTFDEKLRQCAGGRNKEKNKKIWQKKYNFLSLLNIPDAMYKYGPLVNLWEGSNQGEGYLRYAKPRITDIHSKNWQINAHIKLLEIISMDEVIDCHVMNKLSEGSRSEYIMHINQGKKSSAKNFIYTKALMKSSLFSEETCHCLLLKMQKESVILLLLVVQKIY